MAMRETATWDVKNKKTILFKIQHAENLKDWGGRGADNHLSNDGLFGSIHHSISHLLLSLSHILTRLCTQHSRFHFLINNQTVNTKNHSRHNKLYATTKRAYVDNCAIHVNKPHFNRYAWLEWNYEQWKMAEWRRSWHKFRYYQIWNANKISTDNLDTEMPQLRDTSSIFHS